MKICLRYLVAGIFAVVAATVFCGCQTADHGGNQSATPVLRIGVTPDYPPLAFKQQSKLVGLEVELARALAKELQFSAQFVQLAWDEQIGALLAGKTDIIMSGMTATDARKIRINFSKPWLQIGLLALIRSKDAHKYPAINFLMTGETDIGVQKDSVAAALVLRNYRGANAVTYLSPTDAPYYLKNRKIDAFIHDGPAIIWMASENEAELAIAPFTMSSGLLVWGIRKGDDNLQASVDAVLARWKQDGTLRRMLEKWLPVGLARVPD